MLCGQSLSFSIGSAHLLRDVSLSVAPGEFVALVGPNGAGKSTLLRLITGDLKPSAGSVSLNGKPLAAWKDLDRARRVAVLPQRDSLQMDFTVMEVVLLGRMPHAATSLRRDNERIAWECLEATEMEAMADRIYTTLSGGERQRVQLARVLAQVWEDDGSPRFALLDEPTSALDLAHQFETLRIAAALTRRGVGVLAVLHDLNLALRFAGRAMLLEHGRVAAEGAPASVFQPALIERVYRVAAWLGTHPGDGTAHLYTTPRSPAGAQV